MPQRHFYFDYAASTPVDPRVEVAMRPYFLKKFGNAGSLHSFGQEASSAMDFSREAIAKAIGADFREVVFTGSATESNNIALRGLARTVRGLTQKNFREGQRQVGESQRLRIIVSAIEHESILETARDLEKEGIDVVYLPVDRNGILNLKELESALNERTVLVSVMYANNEIGTIQPILKIAEIVRDFRKNLELSRKNLRTGSETSKKSSLSPNDYVLSPLFHTDAVQAFQFLDCDVNQLGVDLMTLSAHKIYGPKGIGALYIRKNLELSHKNLETKSEISGKSPLSSNNYVLSPLITGGGQEFGLRSGTENVPLIVGFAKAVELAVASQNSEFKRIKKLKDYFWRGLLKIYPRIETNSPEQMYKNRKVPKPVCLPNILNIYFPDHESQYLLAKFDLAGIAVSAGSACSARSIQPSYTITALSYSEKRAKHSIRFSFGRPTTQKDIDNTLRVIRKLL